MEFVQVGLDPYVCTNFSKRVVSKNKGYHRNNGLTLKLWTEKGN